MKNFFKSNLVLPQIASLNDTAAPDSVDWRERIRVHPVKDENKGAGCISGYAFSTLDTLELHHFIRNKKYFDTSEQEIIDCSILNLGCHGGTHTFTYSYIVDNGIALNDDYQYKSQKEECKSDDILKSVVKAYGYAGVHGAENFKKALDQVGPLTASVNSKMNSFIFYREGIFDDVSCNGNDTNHEVVIVGYGKDRATSQDYWIIRNSWSRLWGESGYMRIAMKEDSCLSTRSAFFPLLDESAKANNKVEDLAKIGGAIIGVIVFLILICCCCCCCCIFCIRWCCK